MRAGLRWKTACVAVGPLLAAAPALAQTVPDTSSNTPANDAIGPRELQNFSLPGTRTKPAEQLSAPSSSSSSSVPGAANQAEPRLQTPVTAAREGAREQARPVAHQKNAGALALSREVAPAPAQKAATPSPPPAVSLDSRQPVDSFASAPLPAASTTPVALTPEHRFPVLPWIIAAVVVALGGIFLRWRRNRQRAAFAGGSQQYDFLAAPEPAPAPARPVPRTAAPPRLPEPAPAPTAVPSPARGAAAAPRPSGIVASRLRPSIELAVQPLRCVVDDEEVTIEFEVELFNAGTAPARAVIAEASLFNASSNQEQELAAFYARPPGAGDRIDSIPPMRRMTFTNRVVAPRAQVQEYELAGRKSFVPVLAFNARYEWSGGKGQSSLAYLLGRETRGDKLGPLHLDGAQRELRGLGARVLPTAIRT
jgi:hypothetical protein